MLKASARNCKLNRSLILNFLKNEVSTLTKPGPRIDPRETSPKGPGNWQHERIWIEPVIHASQNHRSFKVWIPASNVGDIRIAGAGILEANHRREGEATLRRDDAVPLPAADQLVLPPVGSASEALPTPQRQLIAEVRTELVVEAEGRRTPVQKQIVGTKNVCRLILAGRREDGRVQINHLRPGVIGLERDSMRNALLQ